MSGMVGAICARHSEVLWITRQEAGRLSGYKLLTKTDSCKVSQRLSLDQDIDPAALTSSGSIIYVMLNRSK